MPQLGFPEALGAVAGGAAGYLVPVEGNLSAACIALGVAGGTALGTAIAAWWTDRQELREIEREIVLVKARARLDEARGRTVAGALAWAAAIVRQSDGQSVEDVAAMIERGTADG